MVSFHLERMRAHFHYSLVLFQKLNIFAFRRRTTGETRSTVPALGMFQRQRTTSPAKTNVKTERILQGIQVGEQVR